MYVTISEAYPGQIFSGADQQERARILGHTISSHIPGLQLRHLIQDKIAFTIIPDCVDAEEVAIVVHEFAKSLIEPFELELYIPRESKTEQKKIGRVVELLLQFPVLFQSFLISSKFGITPISEDAFA